MAKTTRVKKPKNRWQERLKQLARRCERYWLSDCLDFYRDKLLGKYKTQNISFDKLAREVFSDYLLLRKSIKGKCKCVTCWVIKDWFDKFMHPWHFRKQGESAFLKYVENNVRPQCYSCNVGKNGREARYCIFMLSQFKEEYVQWLLECKETKDEKLWEAEARTLEQWKWLLSNNYFISYMQQCLAKK